MKNIVVTFRVTEKEYRIIRNRMFQAGIRKDNLSEYIRRQVLGEEYSYVKEKLLREMNYQIRKIGVNINQITARNNSMLYLAEDKVQLKENLKELMEVFEKFQERIEGK